MKFGRAAAIKCTFVFFIESIFVLGKSDTNSFANEKNPTLIRVITLCEHRGLAEHNIPRYQNRAQVAVNGAKSITQLIHQVPYNQQVTGVVL